MPLELMLPALRQAADTRAAPASITELFPLLRAQDPSTDIRVALQEIIDSRHRENSSRAALFLGVVLEMTGDPEGADSAYQHATDRGTDDRTASDAALRLCNLRTQRGDTAGARRAVEQGEKIVLAMLDVAGRKAERGDVAGASRGYRAAIETNHPAVVPIAALRLGLLLEEHADNAGAAAAFQRVVDLRDPDVGPMAAERLGWLLAADGDTQGARTMWRYAKKAGDAQVAQAAESNLRMLKLGPDVARLADDILRAEDKSRRGRRD